MLEGNRLLPFIFTFLPALVYAAAIFLSAPYKSIGRKMSQLYFQMGLISATITSWYLWVFPAWQMPLSGNSVISVLLLAFFQVAVLEEGMKLVMFKATERYRIKSVHPCAIMFYSMCVSAGFAVMENVMYLQMYGNDVLVVRAFSAIILHMVNGLIMGYFLALARMHYNKRYLYEALAFISAVFYHGIYDFNIMYGEIGPQWPIIVTLIPGFVVTFFMWRHLTKSGPCVGQS